MRAAAGDRRLTDDELAALMERGAGNPLFLQELASPEQALEAPEQMPDTVEALVATRIDGLAPGDRALLRWASVLGVSFSGALIADVLEGDPTAASDSEAWDRLGEFVERDPDVPGAFRFRHALIRDGAYEGLSYRRRRELHARVAEVLEVRTPDAVELLSLHYYRADDKPATWRYSLAAGRSAQEKWANLEAAEFYERALDVAPDVPELEPAEIAEVWEALGDCRQLAGKLESRRASVRGGARAAPEDSPEADRAPASRKRRCATSMGRYDEAIDWYSRGLERPRHLADGLGARRGSSSSSSSESRQSASGRASSATASPLQRGRRRRRSRSTTSCSSRTATCSSTSCTRSWARPSGPPSAGSRSRSSRSSATSRARRPRSTTSASRLYYDGDWAKALDVYERSRTLFERIGDVARASAMATNNIGEILSDQGRLEEAEELFRAVSARSSTRWATSFLSLIARFNLGRAAARAGRFAEADELLNEASEGFARDPCGELRAGGRMRRIAEVDVLAGDRRSAPDHEVELAERSGEAAGIARDRGRCIIAFARLRLPAAATPDEAAQGVSREHQGSARGARRATSSPCRCVHEAPVGDADDGGEAQRLLDGLGVTSGRRPPLG